MIYDISHVLLSLFRLKNQRFLPLSVTTREVPSVVSTSILLETTSSLAVMMMERSMCSTSTSLVVKNWPNSMLLSSARRKSGPSLGLPSGQRSSLEQLTAPLLSGTQLRASPSVLLPPFRCAAGFRYRNHPARLPPRTRVADLFV
jgi:hypothetical protein